MGLSRKVGQLLSNFSSTSVQLLSTFVQLLNCSNFEARTPLHGPPQRNIRTFSENRRTKIGEEVRLNLTTCQEPPRQTKPPKRGETKNFTNISHPCLWIWVCFSFGTNKSTIHLSKYGSSSTLPPRRSSWTDLSLVWFAGTTPEHNLPVSCKTLPELRSGGLWA